MLIAIHYKTKFAFKHSVSQSKLCCYAVNIICMYLKFYQRQVKIKDVVTCNNEKYCKIRYILPNNYIIFNRKRFIWYDYRTQSLPSRFIEMLFGIFRGDVIIFALQYLRCNIFFKLSRRTLSGRYSSNFFALYTLPTNKCC